MLWSVSGAGKWPENRCCAFFHPRMKLLQVGKSFWRKLRLVLLFGAKSIHFARFTGRELSPVYGVTIHETGNNPICCKTGWSNVGSKTRNIIHENLSWKPYITSICGKVAKVIGILSRSRRYVPSVTLKTLYNSLFLPYINYSNFIWASTYASYLEPLLLSTPKESHSNYHLFSSTNSF